MRGRGCIAKSAKGTIQAREDRADKLPLEVRKRISNILFLCQECHGRYEGQPLVSDSLDPHVWKDHFLAVMRPQFLP